MKIITIVAILLGFVALSYTQEGDYSAFIKNLHEMHAVCQKETSVNDDLVNKAFYEGVFTDDKNLKCYFKCIFQKLGNMDANGNLDFSKSIDQIPPSVDKTKVIAIIEKCKGTKGTDACDTAFQAAKCIREAVGPMKQKA